ncbi:YadA-like family protein [Veillonella sp. 3627]|uniref:YadA-like family protein n=1 Tax=Veillonella sp. 3627 TaxID=2490953 RepID=UPI000F8C4378|nr:YadA-like family protein [Veillonella sp. 3627]
MNKLFKVIWSKSKQCYIVVSEVAKNTTGKKKIAVASVLAALAVSAQVATVQAAIPEGELNGGAILAIGGNVKANGDSSVVIGKNNEVKNRFSVGIGNNIVTESDNAVAIGSGSNNGKVQALGADSIAMGTRAEATKQSSIAIGRLSKSITDERGVAIGNEAVTTGYAAIAIGNKVKADSKNAISMGNGASAKTEGAVAMGASASAEVKNSVALGEGSTTTSADGADTTGYLTNDTVNNSDHGVLSIGNGSTITRRILSVASGTNDTDAVNVKQLKALRNATLSTLSVVNGTTTTDLVPKTTAGDAEAHKVKLVAGKNITLTANENTVTIASTSEVNSISSGNTNAISVTTGTDGKVSITPNLANDLNADTDANKLVTAGKVKSALEQKANASDVNDLKAKITKLGDTSADGRDGKAATGKAADDPTATAADKGLTGQDGLNGKSLTDKVNALRNGEAGSVVYTDADGKRLVKANDGNYYLAKSVDADGNKIGDAQPVANDKLQASVMNPDGKGGPTTLSNLKDGKIAKNSKDAMTGNQLYAAKAEVAKYLGGGATVNENGDVTEPTFTVKDKDNKDVAAHNVGEALSTMNERLNKVSSAATDISGLKNMEGLTEAGINKIKEYAGQGVDVKGDKNITVKPKDVNGVKTFYTTLSDDLKLGGPDKEHPNVRVNGVDSTVTAGKDDKEVKLDGAKGKVTVGNPNGDKFVELDAATGGVQANKVTAGKGDKAVSLDGDKGTITAGKGENAVAVNGTDATIKAGTGENQVGINGKDGSVTAKTVKAKDVNADTLTLGDKDSANAIKMNGTDGTITAGTGENQVGINGKDGSVTAKTVKAKDGEFGAPLAEDGAPAKAGKNNTKITDEGISVVGKDKDGNKATVGIKDGRVSAGDPVDENGIPTKAGSATSMDKDGFSVATKDKDGKVSKVDIKNGGITAGAPVDANGVPTEKNATAVSMGKDGFSVISTDENGKALTPITIKNGKISGLQPGTKDDDVATIGQVKEVTNKLGAALEKTSQRVSEVGAHSAALAAMNPLSYDPLRKSQIMAGIGSYDGNQALALGIAHYANENFMFNAGITMGSGKSMANIGATYRFGTGDDDNIPERYKGGPISSVYVMQDEITALKAENARKDVEYGNKIDLLMERIAMLEAKLK